MLKALVRLQFKKEVTFHEATPSVTILDNGRWNDGAAVASRRFVPWQSRNCQRK
jgi:hypothetical protein